MKKFYKVFFKLSILISMLMIAYIMGIVTCKDAKKTVISTWQTF